MFIVEHIPTGLFFKGRRFSERALRDVLVPRQKARVFRNISGIKNCLGKRVWLNPPIRHKKYGYIIKHSIRVLDETVWKVHEVEL